MDGPFSKRNKKMACDRKKNGKKDRLHVLHETRPYATRKDM